MANLPTNQSRFSRIRNSIVEAGLNNGITRRMMVNTLPSLFGYTLVRFVSERDDQDFTKTRELLSSMGKNAVKSNLKYLYRAINIRANNIINTDEIINLILDSVNDDVAELTSMTILQDAEFLNGTSMGGITKETSKKIISQIDFPNKSQEELDELLSSKCFQLPSNSTSVKIVIDLFEKLTLEQKKICFPRFIPLMPREYWSEDKENLRELLALFPENERLEPYKKILEENRKREYGIGKNVSDCFTLLSEEDKMAEFTETIEQIKSNDDRDNGTYLITVMKSLPLVEQEKCCEDILDSLGKSFTQIFYYTSSMDPILQEKVISTVLKKMYDIKQHNIENKILDDPREFFIVQSLKNFDNNILCNAIKEVLEGDLDSSYAKFVIDFLNENSIREQIAEFTKNNDFLPISQLKKILENGGNVEFLTVLTIDKECDRIVSEFENNPNENRYKEYIHRISELSQGVKFNQNQKKIFEKKISSYQKIFSKLSMEEKEKNFDYTLEIMINEMKKQTPNELNKIDNLKDVFFELDDSDKILHFSKYVNTVLSTFGNYTTVSDNFDNLVESLDSTIMDKIYDQYISKFKDGGKENYRDSISALFSRKFVSGLIDRLSKHNEVFLSEEELDNILSRKYYDITENKSNTFDNEYQAIAKIYVQSKMNRIKNNYNQLDDEHKKENIDSALMQMSKSIDVIRINDYNATQVTESIQLTAIKEFFLAVEKEEQPKHFDALIEAIENVQNEVLRQEYFIDIYKSLDKDVKIKFFKSCINLDSKNFDYAVDLLNKLSIREINDIFEGKLVLDNEIISQLMKKNPNIAMKTLLFDKDVDREKLVDLSSYEQLQNDSININSVIKNLYERCQGKSKEEFNQLLGETYNLFTYNNVPEFMKNFRIFQLGSFYHKENSNIKSFIGKTIEERDNIILEDLFKISLDSNNESLRDFANVIIEGKRLTTLIQVNPEEKIKTLSPEELALLSQYRDTLFDLHNLTKEIRKTDRPRIEKSSDIIKDFRRLIAVYSDNQDHNPNSKNVVFNPNKIMDELFKGFITTTIRPKAILEYMDQKRIESDERHLRIEQQLRDGTMHLEAGDFIKGINGFDAYIPSMLRDGVKGGEFNQEHSHSDMTPLDADFGYVSTGNLKKENATDYEIIATTISASYGDEYIVLKQYADRLKDRSGEIFDQGTFTGSPDYYEIHYGEEGTQNSRYIRTGIPVTDIDYIVSCDWNPKNGYEMAMAGIYIPVINKKGEIVFSSDDYKKIREEMRGLSHYNADKLEVSESAKDMDVLYAVYRSVSTKSQEEIDGEIDTVRGLVAGKPDIITEQKKKATTKFIKSFFEKLGIRVTDDLSQNLSTTSIELIDTGSTGRGTNVPGDGDFDFMLRHNLSPNILSELAKTVQELTPDQKFKDVGDGFRAKDVTLPTGEVVDIDITTAQKSLQLSYSSDLCVRDRLNSIKENDPESYNYVQANIIMAKKILKARGIYKKYGSDGATEHGGFGGIGVENWILQNGGSFKQAIETFLEAADKATSYDEFKKQYPIFDFGFNHREGKIRHDRFSSFFADDKNRPDIGFNYAKTTLREIQKALELEKGKQEQQMMETPLMQSISPEGFAEAGKRKSVLRNKFSYSKVRGMISKFVSVSERGQNQGDSNQIQVEESSSDLEEK